MSLKGRLASIFDVFSRRDRPRGKHQPDQLSHTLRNRVLLLYRDVVSGRWQSATGFQREDHAYEFWEQTHNALQHLHGRGRLSNLDVRSPAEDCIAFLSGCTPSEFFDFVELSFRLDVSWRVMGDENEVVAALNEILRVEAAPFQLTPIVKVEEEGTWPGPNGFPRVGRTIRTVAYPKVIRAEEETTYSEAIKPMLSVLAAPHFESANLEFRDALDEYRRGHYGDCLTKCGSSFESVMKCLCKRRNWPVDEVKDTARPLLKTVISHSGLDPFFEQPLLLIATMRNRMSSSHGGGTTVRTAERHVAQYALASTAAAILLLVQEIDV